MEEKSAPSPTTTSAPQPSAPSWKERPSDSHAKKDEAWRPRMDSERDLHGFESHALEKDSELESPRLRDPDQDTAPLEGSHDRSDDDSLEPGEKPEV